MLELSRQLAEGEEAIQIDKAKRLEQVRAAHDKRMQYLDEDKKVKWNELRGYR